MLTKTVEYWLLCVALDLTLYSEPDRWWLPAIVNLQSTELDIEFGWIRTFITRILSRSEGRNIPDLLSFYSKTNTGVVRTSKDLIKFLLTVPMDVTLCSVYSTCTCPMDLPELIYAHHLYNSVGSLFSMKYERGGV